MSNAEVWNAYLAKYSTEPKDASQLQAFAKAQDKLPNLSFKEANECYKANKGKGAASGGSEQKQPESSGGGGGNPLFAALNKGGDITKGLKKVTRDMTNKDKTMFSPCITSYSMLRKIAILTI